MDNNSLQNEQTAARTSIVPASSPEPRFEALLKKIGRTSLSLPALPFSCDALVPILSPTTIAVHYGKHHRGYLKNVREAVRNGLLAKVALEEIVLSTAGDPAKRSLFNNAAQAWNHGFYWKSLSSKPSAPSTSLQFAIQSTFGSFDNLKQVLATTCSSHFGSGWGWLVEEQGRLNVVSTQNADLPLIHGQIPLLAIDVWEHAYYLDYRNRRSEYAKAVVYNLLNWEFASHRFERAVRFGRSTDAAESFNS